MEKPRNPNFLLWLTVIVFLIQTIFWFDSCVYYWKWLTGAFPLSPYILLFPCWVTSSIFVFVLTHSIPYFVHGSAYDSHCCAHWLIWLCSWLISFYFCILAALLTHWGCACWLIWLIPPLPCLVVVASRNVFKELKWSLQRTIYPHSTFCIGWFNTLSFFYVFTRPLLISTSESVYYVSSIYH